MAEKQAVTLQKGGGAGGEKGRRGNSAILAASRRRFQFDAETVAKARRTVTGTVGSLYAKKTSDKGSSPYFNAPGAQGYIVMNLDTQKEVAMTREEAVRLSVEHMLNVTRYNEANPTAQRNDVLFFNNAIHNSSRQRVKQQIKDAQGNIRSEFKKDENGNDVYKKSVYLSGINGIQLISEELAVDNKAMQSSHYENPDLQKRAAQRWDDLASGKIPASAAMQKVIKSMMQKSSAGTGEGGQRSAKDVVAEINSFLSETQELLKDVEVVDI